MKNLTGITILLYIILLAGCAGNKNLTGKNNGSSNIQASNTYSEKIAPGQCRIVGTIISVDSTLDKYSPKDPCSIHPCKAVVSVDSIIGYGSSFPPLQKGSSINIYFYFTLGPTTKDLFPSLKEFYPGLKPGDSFTGNIVAVNTMNSDSKKKEYAIYGYRKN